MARGLFSRKPVAMAETVSSEPSGVQVFIPAALNRPTHTLYSICTAVQPTQQEWTVNRRYSQFLQLRKDLIATMTARRGCPGCASFGLALRKFAFPQKTWIRTNRIVRKRVKSLQEFLQLIVQRLFNDHPKCGVCGDKVKKMVRPFLIRGAQPIGASTLPKIQHSLSLQSYAIIDHRRHRQPTLTKKSHDISSQRSDTSTERTDSDPMVDVGSPTDVSHDSIDSYGENFGNEQCEDEKVDLKEALKSVVLAPGRQSTVEEVATRLSSMWSAYDLRETLAAIQDDDIKELRLSATMEEEEDAQEEDPTKFESEFEEIIELEPSIYEVTL